MSFVIKYIYLGESTQLSDQSFINVFMSPKVF